jgi:hypothetical protein
MQVLSVLFGVVIFADVFDEACLSILLAGFGAPATQGTLPALMLQVSR